MEDVRFNRFVSAGVAMRMEEPRAIIISSKADNILRHSTMMLEKSDLSLQTARSAQQHALQ